MVGVYYDPEALSTNLLEEFGDAGRKGLLCGGFMVSSGIMLSALHVILNKFGKSHGTTEEDTSDGNHEDDVLHITPTQ